MIGTTKKGIEEILEHLKSARTIFIIGCGDCATVCQTGGEKEVNNMSKILKEKGFSIAGTGVIDVACDKRLVKKFLRENQKKFSAVDTVLILTCGSGVQTVAESTDYVVVPGLNSVFVGKIENLSKFYEYCSVCGECILAETGGICPVTRCAKGLINGPCGGSDKGKCEANRDNDCAWHLIYERMQKTNQLEQFKRVKKEKSFALSHKPRKIEITR